MSAVAKTALAAACLLLAAGCGWELGTPLECGDGKKADEEECDGLDLGGQTCKGAGYSGGTLKCTDQCKLESTGCFNCGDGKKAQGETCDGAALDGKSCKDFKSGGVAFTDGALSCKTDCSGFETSKCYRCGDDKKNTSDDCDGTDLAGKKCADLGNEGGTLACKKDCSWFDTSKCYRCGDDKKTPGDVCDGKDLGGETCKTKGYDGGKLKCYKSCTGYDVTGCYKCGDGKIPHGDVCDGSALGGKTCKSFGWDGGTLKCKLNCSWFDESDCHRCGDGKKKGPEKCDGLDLGTADCATAGMLTGTLACKKDCTFDTSSCNAYQWEWAVSGGGSWTERGTSVRVDSAGDVLVAASSTSKSVTFGTKKLTLTGDDVVVAKLDSSGKYIWLAGSTNTGPAPWNKLLPQGRMALDGKDNAIVGGYFKGAVSFGTHAIGDGSKNDDQIWVAKVSSAGKWLWAASAGGGGNDWLYEVATDSAGNVYVTGSFNGTADFGSHQVTSAGSTDAFLAKLDQNGKWQWAKAFGSSAKYERGDSLTVDGSGNIYLAGVYGGTFTAGGVTLTHPKANTRNTFLLKISSANGAVTWAKGVGKCDNSPFGVRLDSAGNLYLAGYFTWGDLTFDTTTMKNPSSVNPYVYLAKLDTTGKWTWATHGKTYSYASPQLLETYQLEVDAKGTSYVVSKLFTKFTSGSVTAKAANGDGLVVKFSPDGTAKWGAVAGGPNIDDLRDVALDGKGNIYATGGCRDKAAFGKTTLKILPDYNHNWDMCLGKLKTVQ